MTNSTMPTSPRTVLFLHAYPLSGAMWNAQKAALEQVGYTVIAPSLPGFGGEPGAIRHLPETAQAILNTLPPEPVAIVGLSMGGYLALELLAQAPESSWGRQTGNGQFGGGQFGRVVLADTTCRADSAEKKKDREAQAQRVLKEGREFIIEAAQKEHSPATFEQVKPMIEAASREGIAGALRAMAERPDHSETLRQLNVPLLVLVGQNDELTPQEKAQEMSELGRGELVILPGAAHLSNLDQPAAFTAELLRFLA